MYIFSNLITAIAKVLDTVLVIFMFIVIARAVLSWVSPDPYNPIVRFIHNVTEPVLYQIRKRVPVILGGIDLSPIIVFLVMGATDPSHGRDYSITQLKARISSLERRVESLEKKLQTSTVKRSSAARRLPGPPRDQSLPRGWRRKEFNGIPYYLVPLDQKQSRSAQRSSPKTRR